MIQKFDAFDTRKSCFGCSACASVCPKKAIGMVRDEEGFLYPAVDEKRCVSCGLCLRVCPGENPEDKSGPAVCLAVKNPDHQARQESTSGGCFSLLADWVAKQGGAVYGAAFGEDFSVCHRRAEGDGWTQFRGAKYVQSDPGETFSQVKADLRSGRWVLYSGTPCQIHGLLRYLEKGNVAQDNLVTCDLVCHGAPSPKSWKDYLDITVSGPVGSIRFRDKAEGGWHHSRFRITDPQGGVMVEEEQARGVFGAAYFSGFTLRPSCYACPYASIKRVGDFTLGDFWGIEKVQPQFDDNGGVSLVMLNTPKAQKIFAECTAAAPVAVQTVAVEDCLQPNLKAPSTCLGDRDGFWREYGRSGLEHAAKYAGLVPLSRWERLWYRVYRRVARMARKGRN